MTEAIASMLALTVVCSAAVATAEPTGNACHKTSVAALTACKADGNDDRGSPSAVDPSTGERTDLARLAALELPATRTRLMQGRPDEGRRIQIAEGP
jgi:hypothetical protein